jgi:hypothetical protein
MRKYLIILFVLFSVTCFAVAKKIYWNPGAAANFSNANAWALTDGGTANQTFVSGDTCVFSNTNASNCTLTASTAVADIDFSYGTGYTGTFTHNAAVNLTITGNATWSSTMTAYTLGNATTSALIFTATATGKTFNPGGKTFGNVTFNGSGGGWTLQGNLTMTGGWTVTNGTPAFGGYTVSMTAASPTFAGGGKTYDGTLSYGGTGGTLTITGANTFHILSFDGSAKTSSAMAITLGANITIDATGALTTNGGADNRYRLLVQSNTVGTSRTITITAGATKSMQRVDFQDITGSPAYLAHGDIWDLDSITGRSCNLGGCIGINFSVGRALYWYSIDNTNGHSMSLSGQDHRSWWTGSGGTGTQLDANDSPTPNDTAYFNASSMRGTTSTVNEDCPRIGRIDWSNINNSPTYTIGLSHSVYGSITLVSGMTLTPSTYTITMASRGSVTLNSGGKSFYAMTINSYNGTLTLQDNLICTNYFYYTTGTFAVNNKNITALGFNFGNVVVNMGSGTWKADGINTIFNGWTDVAETTVNCETSTLEFAGTWRCGNSMGANRTFYNILVSGNFILNTYLTLISSTTTITLTCNNFTVTGAPTTISLRVNQTLIVNGDLTMIGSAGNFISFIPNTQSSGPGNATISKSSGTVNCNYLNLTYSTVSGGAIFNAGCNSIDGGNNSGWGFPCKGQIWSTW